MNALTDKRAGKSTKNTLATSDWLSRCEDVAGLADADVAQRSQSNFPKESIMKQVFKFLKKQEVTLAVALMGMVVWAGFAMSEAFNHIA